MIANLPDHPDWATKTITIAKDLKERFYWRLEFGKRALNRKFSEYPPLADSLIMLKALVVPAVTQELASISVLRRESGDVLKTQKDIYGELMGLRHRHHLVKLGLGLKEPLSIEAVDTKDYSITVKINLDRQRGDIKRDIEALLTLLDIEAKMLKN